MEDFGGHWLRVLHAGHRQCGDRHSCPFAGSAKKIPTSRKRREKWGTRGFWVRHLPGRAALLPTLVHFGCGTIRMYGLGDFQPPGYCFCASSFETLPLMMTSSPGFQFTGVETLCLAVS